MTKTSRYGRNALVAHVQTWRPYTLWYVGLLGLAGAGLTGGEHQWWALLAAWATPTIGWIGGHYLGDWFDRRLDAIGKPHRPIPSGRLRPETALGCGIACFVAVGALTVLGGWPATLVALLAAAGIVAYSRGLKARGLAGNLIRGLLGALALLYGALLDPGPYLWALLPFVVAIWAHDTASNLVGTLRDVDGDRAGGYQTMPVRHGYRTAIWTATGCYGLTLVAALVGGATAPAEVIRPEGRAPYFWLLALLAVAGPAIFVSLLAHRGDLPVRTALRAHELLVLERIGLAGAMVALGFGLAPAGLLTVAILLVTGWSQARMRAGYELGPASHPAITLPHLPEHS
ncbi:4-hydroxybenzoate polyprenyltransferase/geranylgeranylglycerol-phosphate geranylgeranyltransferase [Micromonospora pisi]|uniref:4-hydroxybenzoate polyprenyltransferase/geranylgeranylglycerol-phosphate geranylgeranyltransferase n=1 Tax=Micromonospora pisi TaxID=589240 RepID=A0A495JW51_9ACTN|nr:UbiA family prenyltransferase [Micromonospora pisi]RKR92379.1 4-hydroxybenzoate polyprenyltransferase/geranylgeranylglycerol-phosphate geranylgeranyltransferase [Micromonospora pisi]